jgi:hypothetical protein
MAHELPQRAMTRTYRTPKSTALEVAALNEPQPECVTPKPECAAARACLDLEGERERAVSVSVL